jgi:ribokinase
MAPASRPRPLAIDTDPGVDDALALMLALRSPEVRVELITTVAGNVPVDIGTANAYRLLHLIAPATWPVVAQGAARPMRRTLYTATDVHGDDGLGSLTRLQRRDGTPRYPLPPTSTTSRQAVRRLIQLVETHGEDLTIVALGPLTNIARALQQAPDVMRRVARLIIMGGAIAESGNVTPAAEFNIFVDPHAADLVLTAGLPTTLVPLDLTRQVRLTRQFLDQSISGSGSALAQAVKRMTQQLVRGAHEGAGMPMHDPLAMAVALDPSLVQCATLPVRVETQGRHTIGMTIADRRDASRHDPDTPVVDVAMDVDADRMLALFADRVLSTPSRRSSRRQTVGRVVVVGSANIDLTVHTATLPQRGETVLGDTVHTAFGGKGANQALAAKRAGAHVAFVGKLGADHYGHELARFLRQVGVDISGIQWDARQPSGMALITVDRQGQNQITVASGANATLTPEDLDALPSLLATHQVLVTQLENPLDTVEAALQHAKHAGLTTVLNPAPGRHLPSRLAPLVDVLIPNEVEATLLSGQSVQTPLQASAAARALQQAGYATVIITLGKQGLVYTTDQEEPVHVPAIEVQATDATAAGDTFVGYFASALAEGQSLPDALALANAAAALSVTRAGAMPSIPHRQEITSS